MSVVLTAGALEGLPAPSKEQPEWEYVLPMPETGPRTGYDHVALDWNPAGHPPEGIYTVPHFDFHFYAVSRAEQEGVSFSGTAGAEAAKVADSALLPKGYVVPPDTAVAKMGVHGVDPASPEFHGKPFTRTFIYGYYKGRLTFVEPMVTLAYLLSKPDVTAAVKVPSAYSYPGLLPDQIPGRLRSQAQALLPVAHRLARMGPRRREDRQGPINASGELRATNVQVARNNTSTTSSPTKNP